PLLRSACRLGRHALPMWGLSRAPPGAARAANVGLSRRAGRVIHGREPALLVCTPQVGPVLAGEHGRQLGDATTVDADLAMPDLPADAATPPPPPPRPLP